MGTTISSVTLLLFSFKALHAFYLPRLAPVTYCAGPDHDGDCQRSVRVFVNRLNTVENVLPYEYHKFDFCVPNDYEENSPSENLGEILSGERIHPSAYIMEFNSPVKCRTVCTKTYHPGNQTDLDKLTFLKRGISLNYQHHWMVDDLPLLWCYTVESGDSFCSTDFPVGCEVTKKGKRKDACVTLADFKSPDTFYVYNHVDIVIGYQPLSERDETAGQIKGRIVSARLYPRSYQHQKEGVVGCGYNLPVFGISGGKLEKPVTIKYTYSVTWEVSDIEWTSRWDIILDLAHKNIFWFSILSSLVTVIFSSGILAKVMVQTLYKDIASYNQLESMKNAEKELGWILVHGDVFRPPCQGMVLAVLVGSGVQLLLMCLIILVYACLGFLSPANRGALIMCALVLYVCSAPVGGYVSARIYQAMGGEKWKSNVILTAFLCPGAVFGVLFCLNLFLQITESSAAIPWSTLAPLLALWCAISLPLTLFGAFCGFRRRSIEHPVSTNQIPREIPPFSLCTWLLVPPVGGVLPFAVIYIPSFHILNSIWSHQIFYLFGFLLLVFVLLLITCSQQTILLCYLRLNAEDYHWWWRSFLTSGSTAAYFLLYSIHFFVTKLELEDALSILLYFGYTAIMGFLLFLITGSIGFLSCYWFVSKIYSRVKFIN